MEEEIPNLEIMVCLHLVTIFGLVHLFSSIKNRFIWAGNQQPVLLVKSPSLRMVAKIGTKFGPGHAGFLRQTLELQVV